MARRIVGVGALVSVVLPPCSGPKIGETVVQRITVFVIQELRRLLPSVEEISHAMDQVDPPIDLNPAATLLCPSGFCASLAIPVSVFFPP
jgi:hypothetical protein